MSRRGFLRGVAGGAAVAGASGTAAAQEGTATEGGGGGTGTPSGGGGTGTASGGGGGGGGGGGTETVTLVDFAFEPATESPLYITPGTTVEFVWETSTHNIVVDSQPDGANWSGHEPIENAGFTYSHTFEATGEYAFHCQPHLSSGMEGTIIVNEQGAPPQEGGGGPAVPDSAKTLGIATSVALGSTLGLAYVFLKYGGGGRRSTE